MNLLIKILDSESLTNARLAWIDYAKGIAITLVVYRHVLIGLNRAGLDISPDLFITTEIGLTFRMPLFFILSGIFFSKSINKRSRKGYFIHKFKTIMYPYFVWSFIQMSMQMMLINYTNAQFTSVSDYLLIFYKPIAQFWFLYALFNVSALYLILAYFIKNKWILLIVGVVLFYFHPIVNLGKIPFDIMRLFVFFSLGDIASSYLLGEKGRKTLTSPLTLIIVSCLAVIGEWVIVGLQNDYVLLLLIFAVIGSCCTIGLGYIFGELKNKYLDVIRIIGFHSLYIFMLHAIISAAFRICMVNIFNITHVPFLLIGGTIVGVIGPILFHSLSLRIGLGFLFNADKLLNINKLHSNKT